MKPTPEQEAALEAFLKGENMKLRAVAGSGKTTTLRLMAEAAKDRRILYVAFNRSVKEEAQGRFPPNTTVRTLHGLAYEATIAKNPLLRAKFQAGAGRVRWDVVARTLRIGDARMAMAIRETLERFLRSGEDSPRLDHLPPGYAKARERELGEGWKEEARTILEGVGELWRRMADPLDPFPLSHDGYVRLWLEAYGGTPPLPYDTVLVDEAQDLNPSLAQLLAQGEYQRVYVGDPLQEIYGWRGAVNAMASLPLPEKTLSWSFRFGEELAQTVRNVVKLATGEDLPLKGKAPWETEVSKAPPTPPFTVLARTNGGLLSALLRYGVEEEITPVAFVGGTEDLKWLLLDLGDLLLRRPRQRPHPELLGIETREALLDLAPILPTVEHLLKSLRQLAWREGKSMGEMAYFLAEAMERLEGPNPKLILSTAHKAKGLEWDRVLLFEDFPDPTLKPPDSLPPEEAQRLEEERLAELRVLYVAMTRAKRHLSLRIPLFLPFGEGTPALQPLL